MTVSTAEDFYGVLEKSRLLTAEQLAELRQTDPQSDNPREIAKALARKEWITRWQAGQLLAGRSSFYLGKYKLIELLGRGGMGSVFLGQHTTMNRRVALKIIARHVSRDPAALDRFLSEARVIAALDHPNIVQAYSVDCEGDRYYIVMEYVDGRDLQRVVDQDGPLEFARAADFIAQAADGLAHGHQRGIIHCDIKPSNLLVTDQGVVKIVDMGLSRLAHREEDLAEVVAQKRDEDHVLGTVDYLAPEQALKADDFDHRADIYSLGCTLYFLLTGHPPFPDGTLPERILKHQTQPPPSILDERPETPADLVEVCERMMAKDPADRFQTIDQVSRGLASWRPGSGGSRGSGYGIVEPSDAAPPAFPGIAIETDEKRSPRTPPPRKRASARPAVAKSAAKTSAGAGSGGLLATTRAKILVAVAGGVLLLAAGAGAALWLRSGFADEDVSTVVTEESPATVEDGTKPSESGKSEETADPETAQPGDASEPPKAEPAGAESEQPTEGPPGDQPEGEGDSEGGEAPADVELASADRPPAETMDAPTAPPADASEDKPAEKEPKTPEPEKSKPEPKKVQPFEGLPKQVTLTQEQGRIQGGAELELGQVRLTQDAALTVDLVGGDKALGRKGSLALTAQPDGRTWLVRHDGNDAPKTVARVRLANEMLQFQWAQNVEKLTVLGLENCGLDLWSGESKHFLALSRPQAVEPLALNLDAGFARDRLSERNLPAEDVLRLQVLRLEGGMPKTNFKSSETTDPQGKIEIDLTEPGSPAVLLTVRFTVRGRSINVDAVVTYKPPEGSAQPFRARAIEQERQRGMAMQQQLNMMLSQMKGDSPGKEQRQAQLQQITEGLGQLNKLAEMHGKLHGKSRIHYRVFADFGGEHCVDLYSTEAAPAQPAAEGSPESDGPPVQLGDPNEPAPTGQEGGSGIGSGFFD